MSLCRTAGALLACGLSLVLGACARRAPPPRYNSAALPGPPPAPFCSEERSSPTLVRVRCDYYAAQQMNVAWTEVLRRASISSLAAGFPLLQTLNVTQEPLTTTTHAPLDCRLRWGWGYRVTCAGGPETVPVGARMLADFEFLTNEQGAARNTPLIPENRRPWSGAAFLSAQSERKPSAAPQIHDPEGP